MDNKGRINTALIANSNKPNSKMTNMNNRSLPVNYKSLPSANNYGSTPSKQAKKLLIKDRSNQNLS
jgi:hypothetical protein